VVMGPFLHSNMPGGRRAALALLLALAFGGCGGGAGALTPTPGEPGATQSDEAEATPLLAGVIRAGSYVSGALPRCAEGEPDDDCDGVDDDCDGVIDAGCGLVGGKLQVVVAWSSPADIDLYVEEPQGDTMSFQ